MLVTDAIAALGLPPGKHKLGEMEVEINHDKATLAESTTLAGRCVFTLPVTILFRTRACPCYSEYANRVVGEQLIIRAASDSFELFCIT